MKSLSSSQQAKNAFSPASTDARLNGACYLPLPPAGALPLPPPEGLPVVLGQLGL